MKKSEKAVESAWSDVINEITDDLPKSEKAEPEKKYVYVVTAGTYSDYHIEAVFTEERMAKDFIDWRERMPFCDVYEIEKYPLDTVFKHATMLDHIFEYNSKTDVLTTSITRRNTVAPDGYILIVDRHTFFLSPNGMAVQNYLKGKGVDLIMKIAQDKAAEILYNSEFLEEN